MKSTAGSHRLLTALLTLFGFIIPAHAANVVVTYSFTGTGTVVDSTATTLTLEANASGSFLSGNPALNAAWNPITYTDLSVLDFNTNLLLGNFTFIFANGETLVGTVSEDDSAIDASPTGTGPFTQTLTFTGGTGEFAGATGSMAGTGFVGVTDFSVSGTGSVNLAPEPASAALLLCGFTLAILSKCSLGLGGRQNGQLV